MPGSQAPSARSGRRRPRPYDIVDDRLQSRAFVAVAEEADPPLYWRAAANEAEAADVRSGYAQYLWSARTRIHLDGRSRVANRNELAAAIGVSAGALARWLRGEDWVSIGRMHQVAAALDDTSVVPSFGELRVLPPCRPGATHQEDVRVLRHERDGLS